jgi:hypothetical protein
MKRLSEGLQEKILEGYQTGISEARRVDFLFLMTRPSDAPKGCFRQELFGGHDAVSEPGSDHYGVFVTYIAQLDALKVIDQDTEELRRSSRQPDALTPNATNRRH